MELILTGAIAAIPGLIAAGGLLAKVQRLEKDMDSRLSRELFDVHVKNVERELGEIKALLLARLNPGG